MTIGKSVTAALHRVMRICSSSSSLLTLECGVEQVSPLTAVLSPAEKRRSRKCDPFSRNERELGDGREGGDFFTTWCPMLGAIPSPCDDQGMSLPHGSDWPSIREAGNQPPNPNPTGGRGRQEARDSESERA